MVCDSSEWPTSVGVHLRVVSGGDHDHAIGAGASADTPSKRVEPDGRDRGLVKRLAKGRLVRLGQGHPEVKVVVECAHEDVSRASTNTKLISAVVPRGEQVRLELFDRAQVWHQAVVLLRVVRPDNDASIR